MSLNNALLNAIGRYGPLVNQLAQSRYGISGQALLAKLIEGESGGSATARSPVGAYGYTQFMPGTRQEAVQKYGIDPYAGADPAVHAAALHLLGKINGSTGLEGYNPGGGRSYVDYILGQKVGAFGGAGSSASRPAMGSQTTLSGTVTPGAVAGGSFNPGAAPDASLLAGLQQQPQQAYQTPMPVTQGLKNLRLAVQSPQVPQMAPAAQATDGGLSSLLASASQELPGASVGAPKVQITRTQQQTAAAGGAGAPAKGGLVHFDGKPVASWIAPILQYARQHGWNGTVQSGYRSAAEQQQAAQNFGLGHYGPGGPQKSNHRFTVFPGGAVDVTDASTLSAILKRSPYASKLVWAGSKDAVHFSHPGSNGSY